MATGPHPVTESILTPAIRLYNNIESTEQDWQVCQIGQHPHFLPMCRGDSWNMARHGHWADTRDWQAHHRHYGGHQGNNIPFPTCIHCSSKGKCGLLPQHYGHGMRRRCNHLIFFSLIFRPAALCWWAPKIIIRFSVFMVFYSTTVLWRRRRSNDHSSLIFFFA